MPASAEPNSVAAQIAYADFLDRYGDPSAREIYGRALTVAQRTGDKTQTAEAARHLAILDLLAGDREAAAQHAEAYHSVTGKTLTIGKPIASEAWPTAPIPGPLRSFARMAAIAADSRPADVLPALAHNVITNGYQASHGNEALEQTEYLKLVHRYISQARELDKLAGEKHIIEVKTCDAPNVGDLLRTLGFRMRGGCGSKSCSKPSMPRARSSPPIPVFPWPSLNRRCAPIARSSMITIRPKFLCCSAPNIGCPMSRTRNPSVSWNPS